MGATLAAVALLVMLYRMQGLAEADQFASTLGPPLAIGSLTAPLVVWLWRKESAVSGTLRSDLVERALETLARAQEQQWSAEETARRILDPWPLPVRWQVTARAKAVMVSWPAIRGVAGASPLSLDGSYEQIADVFTHPDSPRRLVVLGEPGAGKTVLALRLTLDLLRQRAVADPVPVLLSIATWDPSDSLDQWIAACLVANYRALAHLVQAPDGTCRTLARELVATNRILPVLDGLDEMAEEHRAAAMSAIADTLGPGRQVVLTSRTAEFERAAADGKLARTPVIEILPLSTSDVVRYLTEGTEDPERWTDTLSHLHTAGDSPLAQALSSPLMLSLARIVYHRSNSSPGDLITAAWASRRDGIEQHLLGGFVLVAYTSQVGSQPCLSPQRAAQAQRWLASIALHLQTANAGQDLAWWQLRRTTVSLQWLLTAGLLAPLLTTSPYRLLWWVTLGVFIVALLTTIRARRPRQVDVTFDRRRTKRLAAALAAGVFVGLTVGRFPDTLAIPLLALISVYVFDNIVSEPDRPIVTFFTTANANRAVSPISLLRRDRKFALSVSCTVGLTFTMPVVVVALVEGPGLKLDPGLSALVMIFALAYVLVLGLIIGAIAGVGISAWGQFSVVRLLLALRGRTPLRLMTFLQDAYQRGILRQAGGVYQFRHARLQQQLARTGHPPGRGIWRSGESAATGISVRS